MRALSVCVCECTTHTRTHEHTHTHTHTHTHAHAHTHTHTHTRARAVPGGAGTRRAGAARLGEERDCAVVVLAHGRQERACARAPRAVRRKLGTLRCMPAQRKWRLRIMETQEGYDGYHDRGDTGGSCQHRRGSGRAGTVVAERGHVPAVAGERALVQLLRAREVVPDLRGRGGGGSMTRGGGKTVARGRKRSGAGSRGAECSGRGRFVGRARSCRAWSRPEARPASRTVG